MSGPWEDFTPQEAGPWSDFAAPAKAQTKPKRTEGQGYRGLTAQFNSMVPLGDELVAAGNTAFNTLTGKTKWEKGSGRSALSAIGDDFKAELSRQRGYEADFQEARPKVAALARGTGLAASLVVPAGGSALSNASRVGNMARGATTAGLTAAGYAAADRGTPQERLAAASTAATDPLTLGLGAAAGALAPAASRGQRAQRPEVDRDALRASRTEAYRAVDESGTRYTPEAIDDLVGNISRDVQGANISAARHPRASSMLEDIQALQGQSPSITELDQLRQVIRRDVASSTDRAEAFFGQRMIRQLDDFINSAGAGQVASGSGEEAAQTIGRARDLNTRVRKIEAVDDAVESARLRAGSTGSGGNIDNATRQNLRRVLEDTPNLTAEESRLLEQIVVGTRGQNALRLAGKLSPQGNGLMTALSIGGAAANPLLAVPSAGGALAKFGADRITERRVQELVRVIADGGTPAAQRALQQLAATDPAVAAVLRDASVRLSRGVGAAGGSNPRGGGPSALSAANQ